MDFRNLEKVHFVLCVHYGGGCRCRSGEVSPTHSPNGAVFAKKGEESNVLSLERETLQYADHTAGQPLML